MSPSVEEKPSSAALARAIKRRVWGESWWFRASCAPGLACLLAEEVRRLPAVEKVEEETAGVRFQAPFDALYDGLLRLRTADSLRIRIAEHAASTFPMLRNQLGRISWAWWLPEQVHLEVRVHARRSRLRDEEGIARSVMQAVQQQGVQLVEEPGAAPPFTVLAVMHIDRLEVWLDTSGEPLYRRVGERWLAPTSLRETTAAALALAAGVDDADMIVDPFCGSGTVLEEAVGIARHEPAGGRRTFAISAAPVWSEARMRNAVRTLEREASGEEVVVIGVDVAEAACNAARHNLEAAGVADHHLLTMSATDVHWCSVLAERRASVPVLLSNPPYGRRARGVGAAPNTLVQEVLTKIAEASSGAPRWRVALLYPDPEVAAPVAAWTPDAVTRIRIRGLETCIITGWLEPPSRP